MRCGHWALINDVSHVVQAELGKLELALTIEELQATVRPTYSFPHISCLVCIISTKF